MNGHVGIDTTQATEHLKNILNVGKEADSVKLAAVSNGNMESSLDDISLNSGNPFQCVYLDENKDGPNASLFGTNVLIYSSSLNCKANRSQIIIDNMVDYGWEENYYPGRLLSLHISGLYLAYALRVKPNKCGYVRVIKLKSDARILIKDYKREVKDLAFAHSNSRILLGSVDACGELWVHKIEDSKSGLISSIWLHVVRPSDWKPSEYNRIIWCLYIPDDSENLDEDTSTEDVSSLLVVTHNERVEIWNIDTIIKEYGYGDLKLNSVQVGVQVILEPTLPISDATFSPDGTALAIASLEGVVKFFQVNTLDKDVTPRCLHHWTPHDGKPLTALYFLDNHKNHKPDVQFWKFAITAADNNAELKVWSCETWLCLQTIRFLPHPGDNEIPILKPEFDLSSKYLFLTDLKRKVLYILFIKEDSISSTASICSITEYGVPFPVLNLSIANIGPSKYLSVNEEKIESEGDKDEDIIENKEEKNNHLVKLYWINTKSLQSCRIFYNPKLDSSLNSFRSLSSLSQDSFVYKDGLSDISLDVHDTSNRSTKDIEHNIEKNESIDASSNISLISNSNALSSLPSHLTNFGDTEVLLTPEDFTSPSHSVQNSFTHQEEVNVPIVGENSVQSTDVLNSLPTEPLNLQRRKSSQHSSTSSPSREVAEILAPSNDHHSDEMEDLLDSKMKGDGNTLNTNLSPFSSAENQVPLSDWPQAPDPMNDYRISSRNNDELTNVSFPPEEAKSRLNFDSNTNQFLLKINHTLSDLCLKITGIDQTIKEHKTEIEKLQNEMHVLRQDQNHYIQGINSLENVLKDKMESLIQHMLPEYSRLENILMKKEKDDQHRLGVQFTNFSEEISSHFDDKILAVFKKEIGTMQEAVFHQLHLELNNKYENFDAHFQENLAKQFKGKPFADNIAQQLSLIIQQQIQTACKDIFQNNVIPSLNKTCHQLFSQLNETFQKGTTEYIQCLEKYRQSSCSNIEIAIANLQSEIAKLTMNTQKAMDFQNSLEETKSLLLKQQEQMLLNIKQLIHEEIKNSFKEHVSSALNSRSVTPISHSEIQIQKQHLLQLAKQGHLNEAFQQALTAMDVQLVIFLCESVTFEQVFYKTPFPLQQHVLLSLVNQLSVDLVDKSELKIRYIEEAITNLDSTNPITKEHLHRVLVNLNQKIKQFLTINTKPEWASRCKRLSMNIERLLMAKEF